jgi:hypothetical protein
MFPLEQHLKEWTNRFGPSAVMRNCDIEELEQHVRDSIATLKTKGLDDEEAFIVATHRIGSAGALEGEFAKVNGGHVWGYHVFWMIAGVLLFEVCGLFIAAADGLGKALAASAGGGGSIIGYTSVAITAFLWLGVVFLLYRLSVTPSDKSSIDRFLVLPRGKWIRIAIVLLVPVSAITKFGSQVVMFRLMPAADIGQVMIILMWGNAVLAFLIPMAFLFVMLSIRTKFQDMSATAK